MQYFVFQDLIQQISVKFLTGNSKQKACSVLKKLPAHFEQESFKIYLSINL